MLTKINRNKYAALFLSIYVCFIAITIIHHHCFDFDHSTKLTKNNEQNDSALLDFLGDGAGICAVKYFAQTISDTHLSADEFRAILTDLGINPPTKNISYKKQNVSSTNLLRAPPEVS
jgi:hypothetical protein